MVEQYRQRGFGCVGLTVGVVVFLVVFSVIGIWITIHTKSDPNSVTVSDNYSSVSIKPKSGPPGTKVQVSIDLFAASKGAKATVSFMDANGEQALGWKTVDKNSAAAIAHPDWPQVLDLGTSAFAITTIVIPKTVTSGQSSSGAPTSLGQGEISVSYANPKLSFSSCRLNCDLTVSVPFEVTKE